jgi:hypothetical protein
LIENPLLIFLFYFHIYCTGQAIPTDKKKNKTFHTGYGILRQAGIFGQPEAKVHLGQAWRMEKYSRI